MTVADLIEQWRRKAKSIITTTPPAACGSGDVQMTPTDHAELARLADAATPGPWEWDETCTPFYNDPDGHSRGGEATGLAEVVQNDDIDTVVVDRARVCDAAFIAAANPATILALIAEVAALRGERRDIVSHATMGATDGEGLTVNGVSVEITRLRNAMHSSYHARATEAERKLAEAVGLLEKILAAFGGPLTRRALGGHDARQMESVLATRIFLSKEAERG